MAKKTLATTGVEREGMEAKRYELVYLVSNKFSEDELAPITAGVTDLIKKNSGTIVQEQAWGKRKLAYAIKHFYHAYYFMVEFDATPDTIAKLETYLRLSDEVIRHLVVATRIKSEKELERERIAAEQRFKEYTDRQAELQKAAAKSAPRNVGEEKPREKEEPKEVNVQELDEKLDKIIEDTEDLISKKI